MAPCQNGQLGLKCKERFPRRVGSLSEPASFDIGRPRARNPKFKSRELCRASHAERKLVWIKAKLMEHRVGSARRSRGTSAALRRPALPRSTAMCLSARSAKAARVSRTLPRVRRLLSPSPQHRPGAVDGGGGAGRHRQHDHLPEALSGGRPHRA